MCIDPNKAAKKRAKYEREVQLYEWQGEKNLFKAKEDTFRTAQEKATLGFSRALGTNQAKALSAVGKMRAAKAITSAAFISKRMERTGGQSRTAGRNQLLAKYNKHAQILSGERTIMEAQGIGNLGAVREYQNKQADLVHKQPPLLVPIPKTSAAEYIMSTASFIGNLAGTAASIYTGFGALGGLGALGGTGFAAGGSAMASAASTSSAIGTSVGRAGLSMLGIPF